MGQVLDYRFGDSVALHRTLFLIYMIDKRITEARPAHGKRSSVTLRNPRGSLQYSRLGSEGLKLNVRYSPFNISEQVSEVQVKSLW